MAEKVSQIQPPFEDIAANLRRLALSVDGSQGSTDEVVSVITIEMRADSTMKVRGFGDVDDKEVLLQLVLAQSKFIKDMLG